MRYRNLILAAAVLALACATWLDRPKSVTAQTTYSQPVKVMNAGASQAVPVQPQGTTPVSGTVTVGNTSLPVTVGNAGDGNSIPVRMGVEPWYITGSCSINLSGTCFAWNQDIMANVVVQTVACHGQMVPGDSGYVQVQYRLGGSDYGVIEFPLTRMGPGTISGMDEYAGVQNMEVGLQYSRFRMFPVHNGSQTTGTISCAASGYQY